MNKIGKVATLRLLYNIYSVYKQFKEVGMKNLLASKKALATIIGILTVLLVNILGMSQEQAAAITDAIIKLTGILVGGQSLVDIAIGLKK